MNNAKKQRKTTEGERLEIVLKKIGNIKGTFQSKYQRNVWMFKGTVKDGHNKGQKW